METLEKTSLTDKIINGLKKAVEELEQFRLQASLGKAQAKDVYEEAKKKFNAYLHEAKLRFDNAKEIATEKTTQLKTALEELQVQLALGKAETKEAFEEQRKTITHALNSLETLIRSNKTSSEYYSRLLMETEQFKIKLDILRMQYKLNKFRKLENLDSTKTDLSKKLFDIKNRLAKKEQEAKGKWEHFQEEISDAYSHLKKAFVG
ncbi:MAG: hypothetical protein HY840_11465 [Bacteroidetes bacterium]|nr:hypothetical protein [Bacteroidota bacterium]